MSASRVTTSAAEKSSGIKRKHKRKSKNKNRSTDGSVASTGPVADFQEADFPLLGSQAPPVHAKKENLSDPIRETHQIINPQPTPLSSVGVQRDPLLHVPSQHPPLCPVVGQQPLLSVVGQQPLLSVKPPALPQETPPQPCLQNNQKLVFPNPDTPDELVPPAHPSFYPTMTPATSDLSMRLTFTDARGRPDNPKVAADKINTRLNAIIDDLGAKGKFVPAPVVKDFKDKLLKQCYHARCSVNSRDIRAFDEYSKAHGRIEQLIRIFCWMSPITTLYELEKSLVSSEKVTTFQELRMGPLIKHPLVTKFFQPPHYLQEIPEITAHQIQKTLMKFLDKTRKKAATRGDRHSVEDFLEFFAKSLSKTSPLDLCVRITSFPLAIQTNFRFRTMHKQSRERVQQKVDDEIKTIIMHETDQVRHRLTTLCDPRSNMLARKDPTTLLVEIFGIFSNYLQGYQSAKVEAFFQLLLKQEQVKQMFLLAIYLGAYGIERRMTEETPHAHQTVRQPEFFHKTHGEVLDVLLQLLKRQPFPINLSSLSDIEKAVVKHFGASSFHPLTNTSFLDFLISDPHCKSSLGGSLTVGASSINGSMKQMIMDIISQLRFAERDNKEVVLETLKLQCGVTAVDQIHCGNIEKLISDVTVQEKVEGSKTTQPSVTYLAPLLVNGASESNLYEQWSCPPLGVLGHKSKADAVDCLSQAPLLEDLAQWSHWDLVFRPQHGDLARFIAREGTLNALHALEIAPGTLLRIDPQASHQKFLQAVEALDPINTSGQLVSIVIQQGSVHELSMKLLGNHIQTALDRLVLVSVQSSAASTNATLLATQFIYGCLVRIPYKISHHLSKEVFIEPLRRVSSTTAVEDLLNHCRGVEGVGEDKDGRRHLQSLGMGLGIKAWSDDFSAMLEEAKNSLAIPQSKLPASAHTMIKADSGDKQIVSIPDTETQFPSMSTNVKTTTTSTETIKNETAITSMTENEAQCQDVIWSIRSEDFGIGLELDGHQKEVAEKQRQREGRGLQRLSKELYSKDTHFVLELIQNADDNSYHESLLSNSCKDVPALKFIVEPTSVIVLNNEVGFNEKNIRAICDVGRSTKGAHHLGYIGQKGIGFKSVFRVTDTPEIHSGGYHIRFDAHCDAIGYILPHWIEEEDRDTITVREGWNTTIVLPLKEDQLSMSLVRKFQDIRPSLLLFLHRLRSITVEHQVSGNSQFMNRSDGTEGIIQIEHNTDHDRLKQDTWLVVRKQLTNASKFKPEVEVTEVAIAFPLGSDIKTVILAKDLHQQQVFAFLPLRSYGFRFIVQGDFDLPSSREDVNSDSVWNQFIRDEIPQLFLHALEKVMKLPDLSETEAVAMYLQFIPLDGEIHDFFKPVAIRIRNLLRGASCLPTESGSNEITEPFSIIQSMFQEESEDTNNLNHLWKQPSKLVVVRNNYIRKHIPQSLLNSALHYFYLSYDLVQFLNPTLQSHLGVHSFSIDHLIAVAEAVLNSYYLSSQNVTVSSDDSDDETLSDSEESDTAHKKRESFKMIQSSPHSIFVKWVAQWLACVHIILEEEGDQSPVTVGKLKKTKIIPLTNGTRLATQDCSLFFPSDGDSVSSAGFKSLFDEIKVVDPLLFETQSDYDAMVKPSHRVHSVLELLGVTEMYPAEVIKHHIIPCFQSGQWKTKSTALLTAYLVYIKDSLSMQRSGITEAEIVPLLRDCVALATKKHGPMQPANETLHFSSQFQPTYDLEKLFPDVSWKLVSSNYLKNASAPNAVQSWKSFLERLGIRDGIAITKFNETIFEGNEQWQELREFVGRSPDGAYTLRDYKCIEFEDVISSIHKSKPQCQHQQMLELVKLLDKLWDKEYRQSAFAQCYDGSNETHLKDVPSFFHRALKNLVWLPALSFPSGKPYNQYQLYRGCNLFDSSKANQRLLDCHVPYIASEIKNSRLLELLQIKSHVSAHELIGFLQEWSKASTDPAVHFQASISHMTEVYIFLFRQMYREAVGDESIKDKLSSGEHNLIFVPDKCNKNSGSSEHVKGQFYSVHDVCWMDPSSVLYTHQENNRNIPSDIPKILSLYYVKDNDQQKFQEIKTALTNFGVRQTPTAAAYIATLQYISSYTAIPEKHHVSDFAGIALHLSQVCMNGEITQQFLQQQLRGKKVFPSHRDQWVSSLDTCLLENDDTKLEKFFKECNDVHFLQWPAPKKMQRHMQARFQEQQREEERMHFVEVCAIDKLSKVVQTKVEIAAGVVMPLETLRKRLSVMVPLLQRYLIANEEALYQSLLQEDMKGKLSKMFIGSVLSLECLYSIQHRGMTYHSPTRSSPDSDFKDSSEDDNAVLYVVTSKVDSPRCLVPTLVKIFTGRRGHFMDTNLFESLVKDMLLLPIEEVESVLSDTKYMFGEVDTDDVWVVPFREKSEEPTVVDVEDDDIVQVSHDLETSEDKDKSDSNGLKSWPPKAPISTIKSSQYPAKPPPPGSAVSDVVGEDDIRTISEKYDMGSNTSSRPSSRLDRKKSTHEDSGTQAQNHHTHGADSKGGDASSSDTHPLASVGSGKTTVDRKWHESVKPDAALFAQRSFSIAEALQSISFESCSEVLNQPFLDMQDQHSREQVGQWGEEYVYKYLSTTKCTPNGQQIKSVIWINETNETGKPYDIEVHIEPDTVLYIEVKSTKSSGKELMEFSWNELQFANNKKQNYHLYRVYSAGSIRAAIKWIENLSSILDNQPVRMLIEL